MLKRNVNFNPGPAALPLEVLKTVQEELLDYRGTGISILESSHRGKEFEAINDETIALVREVLGLGTEYHVLFMGGGASTQFALLPMNFVAEGRAAAYVDTGEFAFKALQEAQNICKVHVAFSSRENKYRSMPALSEISYPGDAAFLHICTNNTIEGTEFKEFPDTGSVPLVADMSSDIASRRLDFSKFALFYAGAQKNLGPAGVTLVVVRDDFLSTARKDIPKILAYKTHADSKSLFNTPPVFGVYIMKLVLEWIKRQGGLEGVEKVNEAKQKLLYDAIDAAPDFYKGAADKSARSWMNVTMRLPSEDLESRFVSEAKKEGLLGVKGHRSVGGIRLSIYNAVSLQDIQKTVNFMDRFRNSV